MPPSFSSASSSHALSTNVPSLDTSLLLLTNGTGAGGGGLGLAGDAGMQALLTALPGTALLVPGESSATSATTCPSVWDWEHQVALEVSWKELFCYYSLPIRINTHVRVQCTSEICFTVFSWRAF